MTTFPKLIDPGETVSCPRLMPVPDSDTLTLVLEALDANVSAPVAVPVEVGAK